MSHFVERVGGRGGFAMKRAPFTVCGGVTGVGYYGSEDRMRVKSPVSLILT